VGSMRGIGRLGISLGTPDDSPRFIPIDYSTIRQKLGICLHFTQYMYNDA